MVTNGEVIAELFNSDQGMSLLHSVLPVCGAVVSCVLACVEGPGEEMHMLPNCLFVYLFVNYLYNMYMNAHLLLFMV